MEMPARRSRPMALIFLLGLVTGIAGAVLVPRFAGPYLPSVFRGPEEVLEGVVVGKGTEGDRLLVTLSSSQGTTLATFTKETAKIDLLVREGDSVALAVREYGPFIDNPRIARVVTAGGVPRAAPPDSGSAQP